MRRLWTEIDGGTLIGRKQLLERKIKPCLIHPARRFFLSGDGEVGKTALLDAAFDLTEGKKCLIHGGTAHREICMQIVTAWELQVEASGKPTAQDLEKAILRSSGNVLFIDDLHRLTTKRIDFLKTVASRNKVCGSLPSGTTREPLRPLLAHMGDEIHVPRLSYKDTLRLAEKVCQHLGSALTAKEVAGAARGLPGRVVVFASTGHIQSNEVRSRSEEIDISPLLLVGFAMLILLRFVGKAVDEYDLTLIGGASMVVLMLLRSFLGQAKER